MKTRSFKSITLLRDLSKACPFLRAAFIFLLLTLATSCSSTKKLQQKNLKKETTVDKSATAITSVSSIITSEKIDTTIELKADTTTFAYFLPWIEQDTSTHLQEVETPTGKFSVAIKSRYKDGSRIESEVKVQAIKKTDSITLQIDKKTEANVMAQTQIKNDITGTRETKDTSKQVDKKRFSFTGVLLSLVILIILIIAFYLYNRYKKTL